MTVQHWRCWYSLKWDYQVSSFPTKQDNFLLHRFFFKLQGQSFLSIKCWSVNNACIPALLSYYVMVNVDFRFSLVKLVHHISWHICVVIVSFRSNVQPPLLTLHHFCCVKAVIQEHTTWWNSETLSTLKRTADLRTFISFFSRREGAITRAECARDLWGISAPVTSPSLLAHSCSSGATWWWFGILQIKKNFTVAVCCSFPLLYKWSYLVSCAFLDQPFSYYPVFWMLPVWP